MVGRIIISCILGFMFGATSLVIIPDLGRLAGPFVCQGTLSPEPDLGRLGWRCTLPDGTSNLIAPGQIILSTVIAFSAFALLPVSRALRSAEDIRQQRHQEQVEDAQQAIPARAEVLRFALIGAPKRQILLRAAEVRLTLWVQPPNTRPYEAWVVWTVEEYVLHRVVPGAYVGVRINPAHPERVYPAWPGAELLRAERDRNEGL